MWISKTIKALIVGGASVLAVLVGTTTASAASNAQQGLRGCAAQADHTGGPRSPACSVEGGFHPPAGGIEANHSETLVRDAG